MRAGANGNGSGGSTTERRLALSRESVSARNVDLILWGRRVTGLPGGTVKRRSASEAFRNRAGHDIEGKSTKRVYWSPVSRTSEKQGSKLVVMRAVLSSYLGYDPRYDDGSWDAWETLSQRLAIMKHAVDPELFDAPEISQHEWLSGDNMIGRVAIGYRAVFSRDTLVADEILSRPRRGARRHDLPVFFLGAMSRQVELLESWRQAATGFEAMVQPELPSPRPTEATA